jgi:hypothetical protein
MGCCATSMGSASPSSVRRYAVILDGKNAGAMQFTVMRLGVRLAPSTRVKSAQQQQHSHTVTPQARRGMF